MWCEKYYLKDLSTIQQKSLLKFLNSDINYLSSDDPKNSYRALKSIIMTGNVGNFSSSTRTLLYIQPRTIYETTKHRTSNFFKALTLGSKYSDVTIALIDASNQDVESLLGNIRDMSLGEAIDYFVAEGWVDEAGAKLSKELLMGRSIYDVSKGMVETLEYPEDQFHIDIQTVYKGDDYRKVSFYLDEYGNVSITNVMDGNIPTIGTGEGISGQIIIRQRDVEKKLKDQKLFWDLIDQALRLSEYEYHFTSKDSIFKTP